VANRRVVLYAEPFNGLEELVEKLEEAGRFARTGGHGAPAIETKELSYPGEKSRIIVEEETLSDKSTQLVAVVVA
jgi:hypothetical protein